jgi:hypothetical protein
VKEGEREGEWERDQGRNLCSPVCAGEEVGDYGHKEQKPGELELGGAHHTRHLLEYSPAHDKTSQALYYGRSFDCA